MLPTIERSILCKFIANASIIYGDRDRERRFFYFERDRRSRFYFRRSLRDRDLFARFYFLRSAFTSSGLQPVHPQILQPPVASFVLRTSPGTWHMHDFPDFENAFIQPLQQPFRASNLSSFFLLYFFLSSAWYSGSSPLNKKSSFEHPLQPHVWQPSHPRCVLL
jgi:hypothetical protein